MARAIQKQHLVMERIHRLRQKAADTASQVQGLQTELGRAKSSLEISNADNNRLLGQLDEAEKKRDELQAELDALKKSREKDCEDANNAGFKEAEDNYKKQVFATRTYILKLDGRLPVNSSVKVLTLTCLPLHRLSSYRPTSFHTLMTSSARCRLRPRKDSKKSRQTLREMAKPSRGRPARLGPVSRTKQQRSTWKLRRNSQTSPL
ncbi:hypothetical protein CsSME_00005967 [Camellia sinensis var. sinensis]